MVRSIRKLGPVLLLVCAVGIANPFFDRAVLFRAGPLPVTGGMISMATLMLKGVFAVLASYLLILTTSMESICYALRLLHVPKIMVTMVLLIYRYVIVLLKEAERISQAYSLRAPAQKGIHYRAWGTLLGQLMLRSISTGPRRSMRACCSGALTEAFICQRNRKWTRAVPFIWQAGWVSLSCCGMFLFLNLPEAC